MTNQLACELRAIAGIADTPKARTIRRTADELDRLQRREREARAILEPLAEHDPAIREWLK